MREWEWEGMGINILLRKGMGIFLYTPMGVGWEWEYGHGNGREWSQKSHSRTSLTPNVSPKLISIHKITQLLSRSKALEITSAAQKLCINIR